MESERSARNKKNGGCNIVRKEAREQRGGGGGGGGGGILILTDRSTYAIAAPAPPPGRAIWKSSSSESSESVSAHLIVRACFALYNMYLFSLGKYILSLSLSLSLSLVFVFVFNFRGEKRAECRAIGGVLVDSGDEGARCDGRGGSRVRDRVYYSV